MFKLWSLRWDRFWVEHRYQKKIRKLLKEKKKNRDEIDQLSLDLFREMDIYNTELDVFTTEFLIQEGKRLDLEVPRLRGEVWDDPEWEQNAYAKRPFLSPLGRLKLRRKIDEEKARRFEVRTLWVTKIILPLAGVLVGVIGALTGLVAVLQHKK